MHTRIAAGAEETLRLWRESRRHLIKRSAGRSSLHSWRLCTRRLLALEALLAPRAARALPGEFAAALGSAFHAAGRLRDNQVAILQLKKLEQRFPEARRLARHLQRDVPRLRKKLTRRVRELSYQRLREYIETWNLPTSTHAARSAAGKATRRLASAEERVMALLRRKPTDRQLHKLRLQLKLTRYMMELCRTMRIGARPRWSLPAVRQVQATLGDVTDMTVLQDIAGKFASRHAPWHTKAEGLRRHLARRQARLRLRALRTARSVIKPASSALTLGARSSGVPDGPPLPEPEPQ
jgi:CHAD domain-containing protein